MLFKNCYKLVFLGNIRKKQRDAIDNVILLPLVKLVFKSAIQLVQRIGKKRETIPLKYGTYDETPMTNCS